MLPFFVCPIGVLGGIQPTMGTSSDGCLSFFSLYSLEKEAACQPCRLQTNGDVFYDCSNLYASEELPEGDCVAKNSRGSLVCSDEYVQWDCLKRKTKDDSQSSRLAIINLPEGRVTNDGNDDTVYSDQTWAWTILVDPALFNVLSDVFAALTGAVLGWAILTLYPLLISWQNGHSQLPRRMLPRVPRRRKRYGLGIIWLLIAWGLCCCFSPPLLSVVAQTQEATETADTDDAQDGLLGHKDGFEGIVEEEIQIDDYLSTLNTDELQKICWDRGFELEETGEPLTHADYVEAARRCLTLEEEMNAILNEHPELAAEIEKEIQRLQDQKTRLEEERAAMLAEKELLEAQLEQAGVDLEHFRSQVASSGAPKDLSEMSFPELFLESLRQLYQRVKQDFVFLAKITKPVWQTVEKVTKIGWRYSKPTIHQAWRYIKPNVLQAYNEIKKRIHQVLSQEKSSEGQ